MEERMGVAGMTIFNLSNTCIVSKSMKFLVVPYY